ncbi:MAG: PilZ domain-containing protein [Candidatus Omnitrophica bacterium]|nr:PilZ domain-containing protein [Candidatus Omnitrophota bacterium]
MEDRRMYTRIKMNMRLKFLDLSKGKEGEADTVDISGNGVGFVTKEDLSVNTPLDIWLMIPDQHEPYYVKGEVIWSKQLNGNGQQRVGVHIKEDLMGLARTLRFRQQT